MGMSNFAAQGYEDWYCEHHEKQKNAEDVTGVENRIRAQILKLAVIIAASNGRMTIELWDVDLAIQKMWEIRGNYEQFTHRAGKAQDSEVAAEIIKALTGSPTHSITEKEFFMKNFGLIEMKDWNDLLIKLEKAGIIHAGASSGGVVITLTKESIQKLKGK